MNYIYFNTGATSGEYPVSEAEIRALHPNTSFPAVFSPPEGYQPVFPVPVPAHDPATHVAIEVAPTLTTKGFYEQNWEIRELDSEIAAVNVATKKAELVASMLSKVDNIRNTRIARGFTFEGHTFQSDVSDRENIANLGLDACEAISNGAQPGDYFWHPKFPNGFGFITADNQTIPMDAYQMSALRDRGIEFKASQTFYARSLKDQIIANADNDPESVNINDNWPT